MRPKSPTGGRFGPASLESPVSKILYSPQPMTVVDKQLKSSLSFLVFQLIDYGAILHPGSYFRDAWNCIDALVVSCAIASLVMG